MASLSHYYAATWPGRPPGMPAGDWYVWKQFLQRHGHEWNGYAYDVELHGGAAPVASSDPAIARCWARAIAKRADVVAQRDAGLTVIEVRRDAGWSTIGQLLTYRRLFPLDYPAEQLEGALIVCETIDPDARATALEQGLQIWTSEQLD
jgi:hypothetical protein